MNSDYVRKVHIALQERKESILMVEKIMLTNEDIELLEQLKEIYNKEIILGSSLEVYKALITKNKNIYIIK